MRWHNHETSKWDDPYYNAKVRMHSLANPFGFTTFAIQDTKILLRSQFLYETERIGATKRTTAGKLKQRLQQYMDLVMRLGVA